MNSQPLPPGSLVWVYLRDSGGDTQDLFSQRAKVLEFCQQNQLRIERVFEDAARSGNSTLNREEFLEMITLAQTAKKPLVAGIVCWDMARFSRNLDDGPYYKSLLRRLGYQLVYVANPNLPDGITGRIVESSYEAANALLLEQISYNSRRGLQQLIDLAIQKGIPFWPGRVPRCFIGEQYPTGRVLNDGTEHTSQVIVPDRNLWHLGQMAFELRASRHTYEEINEATGLFNEVKTGRVNRVANPLRGKSLTSRVHGFFANPIYKGVLVRKGVEYPGYVEAMVPADLWQAANSYRYYRGKPFYSIPHPKAGRTSYLLSGLLKCAYCGNRMYGIHSASRHNGELYHRWYYKCESKSYDKIDCPNKAVSTRKIEPVIMTDVLEIYLTPDFIERIVQQARENIARSNSTDQQIARQQREVADLQERVKNLREGIEQGDTKAWEWLREREEQLRLAQAELDKLNLSKPPQIPYFSRAVVEAVVVKLKTMIESDIVREQQLVLQSIIEHISVARETATVHYKLPEQMLGVYFAAPLRIEINHILELG